MKDDNAYERYRRADMGMHILIVGNVVDGLSFVGPFKTAVHATAHAEHYGMSEWTVARLNGAED